MNKRFFIIVFAGVVVPLILITTVRANSCGNGRGKGNCTDNRVAELRSQFAKVNNPASSNQENAANRPPRSRNLTLIGSHDLGGGGFNADVWAHDQHVYLGNWGLFTGTGAFCPNGGTRVVDVFNPNSPALVNNLPTEAHTQTNDVKVADVNTPFFKGALLAVSNEDCAPGGARGFELWDVSDPTDADFLGRYGPEEAFDTPEFFDFGFGVHNVYIFEQGNRVYVAAVIDFGEALQLIFGLPLIGDLRIVDVTDPSDPVLVGDWGIAKNLGMDPFAGQGDDFAFSLLHDIWVEKDIAYLSYWDAGLILLDVSDPSNPQFISRTPYAPEEEGNTHVAVPAQGGNLVIVGDEDFTPDPWGFMRVFNTQDATAPFEIATFATDNALNAPPPGGDFSAHNFYVRGETVYASWYSDGIRVIDISQPSAPREIASFVPPAVADPFGIIPTAAELWGVYVQGDLIYGSDMNAGLYVLKHVP